MGELKSCPLCGGRPEYRTTSYTGAPWGHVGLDEMGTTIVCKHCGCTIPSKTATEDAEKAWNMRAELMCRDVNGNPHDFTCSECGASMYTQVDECWTMIARGGRPDDVIENPSYCPNCGAKVVSE